MNTHGGLSHKELVDRRDKLGVKPIAVTKEGTMNVEEVKEYKSQRQQLMSFMANAVIGNEDAALKNIQSLEEAVTSVFAGKSSEDTFMVTGAQSLSDINMKALGEEATKEDDDLGIRAETMMVGDAVVSGSEQLLRFAKLNGDAYLLEPSGGRELGNFPLLNEKQSIFIILLNLAERSDVTFR